MKPVKKKIEARKLWVAIDVGCHECGVGSEVIGTYRSEDIAKRMAERRANKTEGFRDGGQSIPKVFEITLPATLPFLIPAPKTLLEEAQKGDIDDTL